MGEAGEYYAEKDKEREIKVTDSIFDHHLDTDVAKNKKIITAQSDYDFERHSYD
jgi:hypothetical protein